MIEKQYVIPWYANCLLGIDIKIELKPTFMKKIAALLRQEENPGIGGLVLAFVAGCIAAIICCHFFIR